MRTIIQFFKLVRFPNLVIIALTQYAIRFGIIYPFLKQVELSLFLDEFLFACLVFATVLIAAAGYIINDYFDVKLDHLNKPKQLIIGKGVSRRQAMFLHMLISGIGILIAAYVAFSINHPLLVFFQLFSAILLWFYSVSLKRGVLLGNISIAALTALVPFTAGYYEIAVMFDHTVKSAELISTPFATESLGSLLFSIKYLLYWIIGYSAFAFLLTVIREIIKDCEDIEGDKAFDCKTLPIVYGIKKAKKVAIGIAALLFVLIGLLEAVQIYSHDYISFGYFFALISLPLLWIIFKIQKAAEKKHFFIISQAIKIIMLFGILYTSIIYLY